MASCETFLNQAGRAILRCFWGDPPFCPSFAACVPGVPACPAPGWQGNADFNYREVFSYFSVAHFVIAKPPFMILKECSARGSAFAPGVLKGLH